MILKIAFNNSKLKRKTNPKLIIKAMIKKKEESDSEPELAMEM